MNHRNSFIMVALFLIAAMSSFSAFGEAIDVWMINNPVESIIKAFDNAGAGFTAKTGIKVNYIRVPTNEFHTKLVTSISARQYPDMIIWNSSPGVEFSQTGAVLPVDDVVNEVGRNSFSASSLNIFSVKGTLYEIPFLVRPGGVHMRKDWLEEAGYDTTLRKDSKGKYYIEGLRSWDDILIAAKKMTNVAQGRYGLGIQFSRKGFGDSAGFAISLLLSYGASLVDKDGKVAINSAQAIEAFTFIKKMWDSGVIPAAATTWDGNANNLYFLRGDLGAVSNSNSIMSKMGVDGNVKLENLLIVPFPCGPRGQSFMQANPEAISIYKTAKVDLSRKFARHLLDTATQVQMFSTMGFGYYGPLKAEVIESPLFDNLSLNEKVLLRDGSKIASVSYPGEPNPKLAALYSSFVLDDALSRIAVDKWSPQQVVAELEKKIKDGLED